MNLTQIRRTTRWQDLAERFDDDSQERKGSSVSNKSLLNDKKVNSPDTPTQIEKFYRKYPYWRQNE